MILDDNISISIINDILENMDSYIYEIHFKDFEKIKDDKIKYLIENKKLSFDEEVLNLIKESFSENLINKYILDNKPTILKLIEENKLNINIFDDTIIIKLIEVSSNLKFIITPILKRDWKIKIPEEILKNITNIWELDSIPLLTNQVQFYNFEIFEFLKNLNPNFEKSKVFLKDDHLWKSLATQLEFFNIVTIGKPINDYNMILIKKFPKIQK